MSSKDDTTKLVESTMSQSRIKPLEGRLAAVAAVDAPGGQHSPETWGVRLPFGIVALAPWR